MVTSNKEDYLRALYILCERSCKVRSIELAKYLGVSKPSVSEMLRGLGKQGLVSHQRYSAIKFTSRGRKIAEKLTSKHRLIELFLKNILKLDPNIIHEEAHRLEHAFSDESTSRLRKFLGNPKFDPHGKPIPTI